MIVKSSVNGLLNDIATVPIVLLPVTVPVLDSDTVLPVIVTVGGTVSFVTTVVVEFLSSAS